MSRLQNRALHLALLLALAIAFTLAAFPARALEHFAIYLTRKGFPNRGCFDSTFWLGGGQRGWVDHILKICVIG